jgi:hypothetical protein
MCVVSWNYGRSYLLGCRFIVLEGGCSDNIMLACYITKIPMRYCMWLHVATNITFSMASLNFVLIKKSFVNSLTNIILQLLSINDN